MFRHLIRFCVLPMIVAGLLVSHAKAAERNKGMWEGYDGEWGHVSGQLIALAEAIPAEKFAWRPGPGVRSTAEVLRHMVETDYWLLSLIGKPMPEDVKNSSQQNTMASKEQIVKWLKRACEAVEAGHQSATAKELRSRVKIDSELATADGVYLRALVHADEHMGQLIAYARMNGITPPWSEPASPK